MTSSTDSSSTVNFGDAFASAEYLAFRDAIAKVSLDNKLHIKGNHVIVGKNKYHVPNFVNYMEHIQHLETERAMLLMKYNDVYDKIIVADRPERYKSVFDELVKKINNIEVLIDELKTFISVKNQVRLQDTLQQQIDNNNQKALQMIENSKEAVVVDNALTRDILTLYKTNLSLHNSLSEAKHILPHDYVIVKKDQQTPRKTLKHTTLTKRQKVKSAVKKLMVDKLQ